MFSPDIVESDAFLDMPASSQALYFHLGMYADDDGFVNPQKIMRMMNAGADDLKVIITKRFVLPFENGVVVIKHWRVNNLVRKDFYRPTQYQEQFNQLTIKENGAYSDSVNKLLTNRSRRLGKVRIGKDINTTASGVGNEVSEIIFLFKGVNPMIEKLYGSPPQRSAVDRMVKELGREKLETFIKSLPWINGQKFWPKSTTPVQLENNISIYIAKKSEAQVKQIENKNKIVIT